MLESVLFGDFEYFSSAEERETVFAVLLCAETGASYDLGKYLTAQLVHQVLQVQLNVFDGLR